MRHTEILIGSPPPSQMSSEEEVCNMASLGFRSAQAAVHQESGFEGQKISATQAHWIYDSLRSKGPVAHEPMAFLS